MNELFDFLDDNLSERHDPAQEDSQHWLDRHYPFKGCVIEGYGAEDEGCGAEILEKPGINGLGAGRTDMAICE